MASTYQITHYSFVIARRWEVIHGGEQVMDYLAGADGDGTPEWTRLIGNAVQTQSSHEQQEVIDLFCPEDEHWVIVRIERSMTLIREVDGSRTVGDVLTEMGVDQ